MLRHYYFLILQPKREINGKETQLATADSTSQHVRRLCHLGTYGTVGKRRGLMAPLGKDAMTHGLDGLTMVSMRVAGGMFLFWITSLLMRLFKSRTPKVYNPSSVKEHVPVRDRLMFCGAALFGLVFNQCCYTIGLSLTSPINASIVTPSTPAS